MNDTNSTGQPAASPGLAEATGSPYTCRDYMNAMVEARRERDDISSKLMSESIDAHEWLEMVAKALGIQTGRESWWDSNEAAQRAKVLERIKRLRANTPVTDAGPKTQADTRAQGPRSV